MLGIRSWLAGMRRWSRDPGRQAIYLGDNTVLAQVKGLKMYLDSRDLSLSPHLLLDGEWEPHVTTALLKTLSPKMTVVDVGANVGYFTLLAARAVGAGGRVYAFEPEPRNLELLRRSVEVNGFAGWVHVSEKAVLDTTGSAILHMPDDSHGGAPSLFGGWPRQVAVQTVSLDEFFSEGTRVDAVKLDVEGSESCIFSGMRRVLDDNPDIVVIMEFTPVIVRGAGRDPRDFLAQIGKAGFPLRRIRLTGRAETVSEEQILESDSETLFLQKGG
jgi:FkbM family methyltransferase